MFRKLFGKMYKQSFPEIVVSLIWVFEGFIFCFCLGLVLKKDIYHLGRL